MKTNECPLCHSALPDDAPGGLCPACLMNSVMQQDAAAKTSVAEDWADLTKAFPDLDIEELIGVGGMGRVYRARQPRLQRTVALKVLTPERASDPEWLERFNRESRALARLSHPHIVQVHDFGEKPVPFLIMEFVDGVNLRQAMQNGGLTAREALSIVPKLCDALHYAHEHGVLHRDIKPENILIDTEGRVKLVDFGLAKLRDENTLPFTLTQSGAKLGTIAYMSPEQIEKPADVDHRADIYSLGVVLYEMLTGELPLGRFPLPSEASGVDPLLDGVVLRTLEKRREKRFNDAQEMKSGIEHASANSPSHPTLPRWDTIGYEYESRVRIGSWPLLSIVFSKDPATGKAKRARGVIAIGMHARGVIAIGLVACGLFSWGVISFGVLAGGVLCLGGLTSGVVSIGMLAAYGVVAVAPIALGVTTLGYISSGVAAFGRHVADTRGVIDPIAAQLGDRWLMPMMRWSNVMNSALLSLMMIAGAFASFMASRKRHAWLFLGLSLIGVINYFTSTIAPSQMQTFASRREAQAAEQQQAEQRKKAAEAEKWERVRALWSEWVNDASRTDSSEVRDRGLRNILDALGSREDERIDAGLIAVANISQINTDKTTMRDAIRLFLSSKTSPGRLRFAVDALMVTNFDASDEERILSLVPDCDHRLVASLENAIGVISKRDYTGRFAAPMLSLLKRGMEVAQTRDEDGSLFDSRYFFGPLWGGKFSPEIEAAVIEWSHLDEEDHGQIHASNSNRGYNAFYSALSTQANKSAASVNRLLELAQHPDVTNIAGRCLWGLQGTVPDEADQTRVADAVIKILESRNAGYQWTQGLRLLQSYATKSHLPALVALAARPALPPEHKNSLDLIITHLKQLP